MYPNGNGYKKDKPIRELKGILSRLDCKKQIIYINNRAKENYECKISENEWEISGDNSCLEFSGWQKGVDFVKAINLPCDAFIFVNDMFLHRSFIHRSLINQKTVERAINNNAMIGWQMRLPLSGKIMGNDVIPYLRTHIFVIPKIILDSLGSVVTINQEAAKRFFIPEYDPSQRLLRCDAPLSKEMSDFIFSYVTSKWHNKKPYTRENFESLRNKAASILNSFLLSIRVEQLGYPLLSFGNSKLSFFQAPCLFQSHQAPVNQFWLRNLLFYRYLPEKKPTFSWRNFKNILEKQFIPAHL